MSAWQEEGRGVKTTYFLRASFMYSHLLLRQVTFHGCAILVHSYSQLSILSLAGWEILSTSQGAVDQEAGSQTAGSVA